MSLWPAQLLTLSLVSGRVALDGEIGFTLITDLTAEQPQFNLTCISTGGPATTVTWTRDSTPREEETDTVLADSVAARYTHTLTLTGRLGGAYTCTVANSISSTTSRPQTIQGN